VTDIQPGDVKTDLIMTNTDKEAAEIAGVQIGEIVGKGSTRNQVGPPRRLLFPLSRLFDTLGSVDQPVPRIPTVHINCVYINIYIYTYI
jgi:hypothetical protein